MTRRGACDGKRQFFGQDRQSDDAPEATTARKAARRRTDGVGKGRALADGMLTSTAVHHVKLEALLALSAANLAPSRPAPDTHKLRAAVHADSEDVLYAPLSYDVSCGGVFVATAALPPLGARVELTLTLPGGDELELKGVVRWIRDIDRASADLPMGCGIEWKAIPAEALLALKRFAEVYEPLLWLPEIA